jgi:hypothetical protein
MQQRSRASHFPPLSSDAVVVLPRASKPEIHLWRKSFRHQQLAALVAEVAIAKKIETISASYRISHSRKGPWRSQLLMLHEQNWKGSATVMGCREKLEK